MKQRDREALVNQLLLDLADLPVRDALEVLNRCVAKILQRAESMSDAGLQTPVISIPERFVNRRHGRPPMIESDHELRDFVISLANQEKPPTYEEISDRCAEKFGDDRAPSKSAVHRYIKRLGQQFCASLEGANE